MCNTDFTGLVSILTVVAELAGFGNELVIPFNSTVPKVYQWVLVVVSVIANSMAGVLFCLLSTTA